MIYYNFYNLYYVEYYFFLYSIYYTTYFVTYTRLYHFGINFFDDFNLSQKPEFTTMFYNIIFLLNSFKKQNFNFLDINILLIRITIFMIYLNLYNSVVGY